MEASVKKGGAYNLKEVVKYSLDTYNFVLDEEAEFFLDLISKNVQYKIFGGRRAMAIRRRESNVKSEREKRIETAYKEFSINLINNAHGKILTTNELYLTMKGLCPMWPFC